jgi:ferrous iron transport protein A
LTNYYIVGKLNEKRIKGGKLMACPITFATLEKEVKIVEILGGDRAKSKLSERGFCVGECLCAVEGSCRGDIVLKTKNSKYAMGFGLASKIIVEEIS